EALGPGQEAPIAGQEALAPGQEAPTAGQEALAPGQEAPTAGQEALAPGQEAPIAGQEALAPGQEAPTTGHEALTPGEKANQTEQAVPYHWLDKTRQTLYATMWHSAEHVDRWFGSGEDETVYQQVYGSIAPAILYTQYNGVRTQARFNMNFPLPQVNDRIHAFVGRFDPNEFITERDEPSGSLPRTYGAPT